MNRARRTLPPVVTVPAASIGASTWKARPSASAPSTIVPKKKRAERKCAKAMHEWQSGAHQPEGAWQRSMFGGYRSCQPRTSTLAVPGWHRHGANLLGRTTNRERQMEPPSAPPGAPEEATFDLWIVGVVLAALSNMLSSLGLLVMKVSADQDKGKACHRRAVAHRGP